MSSVVISGDVSGSVTLQAPSAAGSTVVTLPANSMNIGNGGGSVATNTALGANALAGTNTGGYSTGVGYEAAYTNTSGAENTAVGYRALKLNSTGNGNTALGNNALVNNTGSNNLAVGGNALKANTSGTANVAVGNGAYNATDGALGSNTTGSYNTALGMQALLSNTTASGNTAVGYQAGYAVTTSYNNVFIGSQAGAAVTTAQENTYIGVQAGQVATGYYNTFLGKASGVSMTTGYANTILGRFSGNQGGLDIRTANNKIVLSDGDGNPVAYSEYNGDWCANHTSTAGNSQFTLSRGGTKRWWMWNDNATNNLNIVPASFSSGVQLTPTATAWSAYSDRRIKSNIVDLDYGLSTIMEMQPRRYTVTANGENSIGFIAQELKAVLPEAVVGEEIEFDDADTPQERSSKTMGIAKDHIIPVLVKAIQEQQALITQLQADVAALKGQ